MKDKKQLFYNTWSSRQIKIIHNFFLCFNSHNNRHLMPKMQPKQSHTNCFDGHGDKFIIFLGGNVHRLSHVLCRVTWGDSFPPAHVPAHHVAESQDCTVLSLRTLCSSNTNKHLLKVKICIFKIYKGKNQKKKWHTWLSLVILTRFCTAICSSFPVMVEITRAYSWAASSLMSSLFVFIRLWRREKQLWDENRANCFAKSHNS